MRDHKQLIAALHWLIDDLLTLEVELRIGSGQRPKEPGSRLELLGKLDGDKLAAALREHKGDERHHDLVRLLEGYWKKKQPRVQGRTWINFARGVRFDDPMADWAQEMFRAERDPGVELSAALLQTAWYVVLGTLTPDQACAAVEARTGKRPLVAGVDEAAKARTGKSKAATSEELRARKVYVALGKGFTSPKPLHMDTEREGFRPEALRFIRSARRSAEVIARATREGRSVIQILDEEQRAGQPTRWKARYRIEGGSRIYDGAEPDTDIENAGHVSARPIGPVPWPTTNTAQSKASTRRKNSAGKSRSSSKK